MWGCRLAWSRLGDLGSLDPGSNPGSPIRSFLFLLGFDSDFLVIFLFVLFVVFVGFWVWVGLVL